MLPSLSSINCFCFKIFSSFVGKFWCLSQSVYLPNLWVNSGVSSHLSLRLPLTYWWIPCLIFFKACLWWWKGKAEWALKALYEAITCTLGPELLPGSVFTAPPPTTLWTCKFAPPVIWGLARATLPTDNRPSLSLCTWAAFILLQIQNFFFAGSE